LDRLRSILRRIDGKGYKAYKDLAGTYDFGKFLLSVDHVQGDPFAAPSRISLRVSRRTAGFPERFFASDIRKTALQDYLGRAVSRAIVSHVKGNRGIGKSGMIHIEAGGQEVLKRNAVVFPDESMEARITVGLPASGRTVLGHEAEEMFFNEIPAIVEKGLIYAFQDGAVVERHVNSIEDQEHMRGMLEGLGLAAFVADASVLPRRSGVDNRPLVDGAVLFKAPASMAVSMDLPNAGRVSGMGIPKGITLIVGGGFHGKSTLLHALERGVYNHVPGDGRERVVTDPTAVKIRSEDGRAVSGVNISAFIDRLPFGRDTRSFSTVNASGSTSQAANIVEAIEGGSRVLLIDEDTSATNFMIRDDRMQALVSADREPITPFLHRARELYEGYGVSSIIVMGGSGDYFDISDTVIMMDAYEPANVTEKAAKLAVPDRIASLSKKLPRIAIDSGRVLDLTGVSPSRGRRDVKIDARGLDTILFGRHEIDLGRVEQLVEEGQTRAVGLMIHCYMQRYAARAPGLREGLEALLSDTADKGLDMISPYKVGNLAMPRIFELASAINRIRTK